MTLVERLVAAGMSQDCAVETAMWYMAQGDDEGLESYVVALESLHDLTLPTDKSGGFSVR